MKIRLRTSVEAWDWTTKIIWRITAGLCFLLVIYLLATGNYLASLALAAVLLYNVIQEW